MANETVHLAEYAAGPHPEDELLHVLDGAMTLDIVEQDRVQSFEVGAGMIAIAPASAWQRADSADGPTVMSATIPGEHIDLDVDNPRTVERQAER